MQKDGNMYWFEELTAPTAENITINTTTTTSSDFWQNFQTANIYRYCSPFLIIIGTPWQPVGYLNLTKSTVPILINRLYTVCAGLEWYLRPQHWPDEMVADVHSRSWHSWCFESRMRYTHPLHVLFPPAGIMDSDPSDGRTDNLGNHAVQVENSLQPTENNHRLDHDGTHSLRSE